MSELINRLFGLSGAVALVTGSSAGIGLALARGLADAGARVVVNGRTPKTVESVVEDLRAAGAEAYAASFDVTDRGKVGEAAERIEAEFGPIDILVNNAGIQRRGPLEDYPEETWRELMRANLDSVFFVSQAVARFMIPRKRGRIINIGSVQSELARPNITPYTASKGGVKMLTKGDRLGQARPQGQRHRAGIFQNRAQQGPRRGREVLRLAHWPDADGPLGRCR